MYELSHRSKMYLFLNHSQPNGHSLGPQPEEAATQFCSEKVLKAMWRDHGSRGQKPTGGLSYRECILPPGSWISWGQPDPGLISITWTRIFAQGERESTEQARF